MIGYCFEGGPLDVFLAAAAVPGQDVALLLARWPCLRLSLPGLLASAANHGVEAAVACNMGMLRGVERPSPALEIPEADLLAVRDSAVHAALWWEREAREVLEVLGTGGAAASDRPIVLKGGALRYMVYGEPWLRATADLDLLLPPSRIAGAAARLVNAGFEECRSDPRRPWSAVHGHHRVLRRRTFRVELHRSPDNAHRASLSWEALSPRAAGLPALHPAAAAPCPEAAVLLLAVHALKHGLYIPLKDLVDLHLLAGRLDGWDLVLGGARAEGLDVVLGFLLSAAAELLGTVLPGGVLRELRPFLPHALVVRSLFSCRREGFLPPALSADGKVRKLLAQLLLAGGPGGAAGAVAGYLRRGWMDAASMATRRSDGSASR